MSALNSKCGILVHIGCHLADTAVKLLAVGVAILVVAGMGTSAIIYPVLQCSATKQVSVSSVHASCITKVASGEMA